MKGVTMNRGKWMAHIKIGGRLINLGRYDGIQQAAAVRRAAETVAVSKRTEPQHEYPGDEWKKYKFSDEPARSCADLGLG